MSNSSSKRFLGAQVPNWLDVKYYNARIQPSEAKDLSAQTDFQWQIVKTRYLIWKYKELLAAPVIGRPDTIYIIVPNVDAENGTLVEFAKESNIILNGPYHLTNDIYQLCITYSIGFRLSPLWNRVGGIWIYSLDFLTSTEPLPAVIWEPCVAGGYLRATIQAIRARMNFLVDLKDYGIDLEQLKTTGRSPISGTAYILPNQKLCHLVCVLTTIPSDCPFPNYTLLRKHWKNTYGLRLPHDGSNMLYVQVRFGERNDLYAYPILCVRPSKLRKLPARNVQETVAAFANSIMERCKTICGRPIVFNEFESESPAPLQHSQNIIPLRELPLSRTTASLLSEHFPLSSKPRQEQVEDAYNLHNQDNESLHLEEQMLNIPVVPELEIPSQGNKTKFVPSFSKQRPATKTDQTVPEVTSKKKFIPVFKPRAVAKPLDLEPSKQLKTAVLGPALVGNLPIEPNTIGAFSQPAPLTTSVKNEPPALNASQLTQTLTVPKIVKAQLPVGATPAKIRKPKPPPEDIAILAKSRLLHKATVPSLKEFCKDRKIIGISKDKKEVLIEKVYRYFGLSGESKPSFSNISTPSTTPVIVDETLAADGNLICTPVADFNLIHTKTALDVIDVVDINQT